MSVTHHPSLATRHIMRSITHYLRLPWLWLGRLLTDQVIRAQAAEIRRLETELDERDCTIHTQEISIQQYEAVCARDLQRVRRETEILGGNLTEILERMRGAKP